jgi:hypothetical protein
LSDKEIRKHREQQASGQKVKEEPRGASRESQASALVRLAGEAEIVQYEGQHFALMNGRDPIGIDSFVDQLASTPRRRARCLRARHGKRR